MAGRVSKIFSVERPIRFSHCDPAGIVYFAHFFDMFNAAVEDWFEQALGLSFEEMHMRRQVGFPVVNTQCEFLRVCRLGERLRIEFTVARLGHSSVELDIRGKVGGEERFRARHKIAMMSLATYRAVAIPEELREKMQKFVAVA